MLGTPSDAEGTTNTTTYGGQCGERGLESHPNNSRMGTTPHPAIPTQAQLKRLNTLIQTRQINNQQRATFEADMRKGMTAARVRELTTWLQSRPITLNRQATSGGISRLDPRDLD